MPESAGAPLTGGKFLDDLKLSLHDRHENHLCNPVARLDDERFVAAIPARHKHLSLVIRIDEPDQVTEHDAVLMAKARTRQDHGREPRIVDMYRHPGRYQCRVSTFKRDGLVDTGTQIVQPIPMVTNISDYYHVAGKVLWVKDANKWKSGTLRAFHIYTGTQI